jgi:hypothetical protein
MKILFIAMSESIHTARWINQIADQGWEIHLFPSIDYGITHPDLKNVSIYHSVYRVRKNASPHVRYFGIPVFSTGLARIIRQITGMIYPDYRANQLKKVIAEVKPDIIHSMEFQAAGYLTAKVKEEFPGKFPPWVATSWGSDLLLFGRLPAHADKIKNVLSNCEYYTADCQRDIDLAKKMGFLGKFLPVIPAAGGFNLPSILKYRDTPTSERKLIMIKGYQGWSGRALVALAAIKKCADVLSGFSIEIFLADNDVVKAAEQLSQDIGIPVRIIHNLTHTEMLKKFGKARIFIGLGISDGAPTSMLEAIVMGAFPIQSDTSCANEWIVDGKSGFIVPPEDPDTIAIAIRKALVDDDLVNNAAQLNEETARKNLDSRVIRQKVIELYTSLVMRES